MTSKICVVIPAYNASKTIKNVVTGALKHIPMVVVVDDGSKDNTATVASEAGARVIVIDRNRGKGNALKAFFRTADEEGYHAVISMDADGQHDPEDIPLFLNAHNLFPDDIISGSRFHEKEKMPRVRYHIMLLTQFYISLAANQFLEDTQCGFRLYPLPLIRQIRLTTERYVTESELLMKTGDMGMNIRFVNIKTIYSENLSHIRPVADFLSITAYIVSYLYIKLFTEGVTSNNPNTYKPKGHLRDRIGENRGLDILFQIFTILTALPASAFLLIEYILLRPFISHNFASIRKLNCCFSRITLATHMIPVGFLVVVFEKIVKIVGFKVNIVDGFITKFFPNLWKDKAL
ncbi:MAG: glycosyltransferase family 2 protein [Candidatus Brocadiales bacterium]